MIKIYRPEKGQLDIKKMIYIFLGPLDDSLKNHELYEHDLAYIKNDIVKLQDKGITLILNDEIIPEQIENILDKQEDQFLDYTLEAILWSNYSNYFQKNQIHNNLALSLSEIHDDKINDDLRLFAIFMCDDNCEKVDLLNALPENTNLLISPFPLFDTANNLFKPNDIEENLSEFLSAILNEEESNEIQKLLNNSSQQEHSSKDPNKSDRDKVDNNLHNEDHKPDDNLINDIDKLEKERAQINNQINAFHNKVNDGTLLKELVDDEKIDELYGGLSEIEERLNKADKDLINAKSKYAEVILQKKQILKWLLIINPIIIAFIFLGIIILSNKLGIGKLFMTLREQGVEISNLLAWIYLGIFIFLCYSIFAYFKYRKSIGREIKSIKRQLALLKGNKMSLMLRYIDIHNDYYYSKFKLQLQVFAFEWIEEIIKYIGQYIIKIEDFISQIYQKRDEAEELYNKISEFKDTLFEQNILNKEDVDRYFNKEKYFCSIFFHDPNSEKETLTDYLNYFIKENNDLTLLNEAIANCIQKHYSNIKENTINDLLFDDKIIRNRLDLTKRFKILLKESCPLIDINEEVISHQTSLFSKIHVPKIQGLKEAVERILEPLDEDCTKSNDIDVSNLIIRTTMRVGFPAYAIKQFINIIEELESDQKTNISDYYIHESYVGYDINPSFHGLEDTSESEIETLVLKAIALNLIILKEDKVTYKEKDWTSFKDCTNFLDLIKGESIKKDLQDEINKIISDCQADDDLAYSQIKKIQSLIKSHKLLKEKICIEELLGTISPM